MAQTVTDNTILEVKNLKTYYPIYGGFLGRAISKVKAVDDVTFSVKKGETFSIVGESGCGKSTTGMSLIQLVTPTSGEILFNGENIFGKDKRKLKKVRRNIQIIFQDPFSSLNPKMTVKKIIAEPLVINRIASGQELEDRVVELLEMVGLGAHHLYRYPHEFSGGQRQRLGIARALALNPEIIICDEPVSALDVSVQSQVLNLMQELQEKLNLTFIFISHDLSVVGHISDHVAVMYLGRIIEMGTREEIYQNPQHPYTKSLMSSIPLPDPKAKFTKKRIVLEGDVPSPENPPTGCHFHPRCPYRTDKCKEVYPEFMKVTPNHSVACHLVESGQLA
ncbi:ABC transporter ATP-binding protein [Neobacillus jeddahensis]|uniref:ABC transporter ATP-binding protein n=1 Tax=Neobacillus jeddahensis TaxID=1461580 RepID=UPI0005AA3AB4|nr:dipeptide ABC transporter ATP-binding protein [Neobacillus jeddahensis]